MEDDQSLYIDKQKKQSEQFECKCLRCGACCGAFEGDPCANLAKDEQGKYFCRNYDSRIGLQKTVSGKAFHCVSIRDVLNFSYVYPGCAYNH